MKILVCDDNSIELVNLSAYIAKCCEGADIYSFSDGAKAVEFINGSYADLLVTDIRMPFYTRLEVASQ